MAVCGAVAKRTVCDPMANSVTGLRILSEASEVAIPLLGSMPPT